MRKASIAWETRCVAVDPGDPGKGFIFDGRIAEDFKLATGTWVSVGPLRAKFLGHCAPYLRDMVFAGHDGHYVAALIFPNVEACRALVAGGSDADVVRSERVHAKFQKLLGELAETGYRQLQPRGARHADGRAAVHRQA